jgi:hypothetical protein
VAATFCLDEGLETVLDTEAFLVVVVTVCATPAVLKPSTTNSPKNIRFMFLNYLCA